MTESPLVDVAVVGSGCTGAMAAETLVEAGARVAMLDVGLRDERYRGLVPPKDFLTIRRTEPEQHRYLLGDDLEAIPRGPVSSGAQLTPPRQHMVAAVDKLLPVTSDVFSPVESLAYGGLGCGWGLGCNMFSPRELEAVGLDPVRMRQAYRVVAARIGVSGLHDDAGPYTCGDLDELQSAVEPDLNGRAILDRYERRRARLNRRGFYLGRPALALLTRDKDGRRAIAYRDMDFYEDLDEAAYRPWVTVERLRRRSTFEYRGGSLVLAFRERADHVEVETLHAPDAGEKRIVRARRLVLAAGVLGTARVVLRSARREGTLSLLSNPYTYMPCLQPRMLGAGPQLHRTSLVQAMMFHDPSGDNFDVAQASIYSYGSLLLFRLVNEVPLDVADARILLQHVVPALVIAGVHHPEAREDGGRMRLVPDGSSPTGDRLVIDYPIPGGRRRALARRERRFMRALRMLGCHVLRRVRPPMGASIHYASSMPFSDVEVPFTLSPRGRLHGTRRVYVVDGSGFRYLPAKGVTFSLMANAHDVAQAVLSDA